MRIRSIKPEFWNHPIMARENDAVRLLALGLLSYADDEGYFYADETLVRNSLRPYDYDSRKSLECIERLVEVGYIEVIFHETHGKLGKVVNFTKHQKVCHPTKSRIEEHWLSGELKGGSRVSQEFFCPDQGSKGSREQGSGVAGEQGSWVDPPCPVVEKIKPDPSEQELFTKSTLPGNSSPPIQVKSKKLGLLELRQIPNLKLNKPEDHPTWIACLNAVGVKILTQAGQRVAERGETGWCSRVVPLAYSIFQEIGIEKHHQKCEEIPDDLNDLPDGHPLKPKAKVS